MKAISIKNEDKKLFLKIIYNFLHLDNKFSDDEKKFFKNLRLLFNMPNESFEVYDDKITKKIKEDLDNLENTKLKEYIKTISLELEEKVDKKNRKDYISKRDEIFDIYHPTFKDKLFNIFTSNKETK